VVTEPDWGRIKLSALWLFSLHLFVSELEVDGCRTAAEFLTSKRRKPALDGHLQTTIPETGTS
jgi:hypothetical protein